MPRHTPSLLITALILGLTAGLVGCDEDAAPPAVEIPEISDGNDAVTPGGSEELIVEPAGCAQEGTSPKGTQSCCSGLTAIYNSATTSMICIAPIGEPPLPPASTVAIIPVSWNLDQGLLAALIGKIFGNTKLSLKTIVFGGGFPSGYLASPYVRVTGSEAKPAFACNHSPISQSSYSHNLISKVADAFKPEGCKNQPGVCWQFNITFDSFTNTQDTCTISVDGQEITFQVKKQ